MDDFIEETSVEMAVDVTCKLDLNFWSNRNSSSVKSTIEAGK